MEKFIQEAKEILQSEVDKLNSELAQIDDRRQHLIATLHTAERGLSALDPEKCKSHDFMIRGVNHNQFRGKKLAAAISEYLETVQRGASIDELLEALKQGNADLGKAPGREWTNIKIAVSTNEDMFNLQIRGHLVSLKAK